MKHFFVESSGQVQLIRSSPFLFEETASPGQTIITTTSQAHEYDPYHEPQSPDVPERVTDRPLAGTGLISYDSEVVLGFGVAISKVL